MTVLQDFQQDGNTIEVYKSMFKDAYIATVVEGKYKGMTEEGVTPGSAETTLKIRINNLINGRF